MTRRCRSQGSDPIPDTVVRQWNKTNSCYGSRQTLTSASDSVLCLMRISHARFLSDSTHCQLMTSKSFYRTTVSDPISCYGSRQSLTSASDSVFCLMRIAHARFLSDTKHYPMLTSKLVVQVFHKTYSGYRNGQSLTSASDSVLRLMRIAHARFLSDTTHCPRETSKSDCRTIVSDKVCLSYDSV